MKVYVVLSDIIVYDKEAVDHVCCKGIVDRSDSGVVSLGVFDSLDTALEYLEVNGYVQDHQREYIGNTHNKVSYYYWYDHHEFGWNEVECAWVEEHEIIDDIDYFWTEDFDKIPKCCGNCEKFQYFADDINIIGDLTVCEKSGESKKEFDRYCDDFEWLHDKDFYDSEEIEYLSWNCVENVI